MESRLKRREAAVGTWDEEHVKALLHFPRFPLRLIQQEPWQSWIGQRGGLKAVFDYLQSYPLSPSHQRIFAVVLTNPEATADVYASTLNISRATYFYQLRELISTLAQALNHWELSPGPAAPAFRVTLPAPVTSLVGAEATLQTLSRLLMQEDVRLLTLLGPGGIGKTRLALELALRFQGESCFVDLSGVHDSTHVAADIAHALGINDCGASAVLAWLSDREFFLVLDNFEQILSAASLVTSLLTAARGLKILVTSRVALNLYGEHEFVVPPLAMSDIQTVKDQQLWAQSPAVALFVQRARAVNPNFDLNSENAETVAELCLRTEGLPLAIELAAYQIKYYSPRAILAHLETDRLNFLSSCPKRTPLHQKTMRAMLDWSYNLLPPELQTFFSQLSCFEESFSASQAEEMFPNETVLPKLLLLVDHSLLEQCVGSEGETQYHMIGIVREYAFELHSIRNSRGDKSNPD